MILTTSTLTFELLIDAHEYEKTRTSDVIFWYPTLRNISGFGGGGVRCYGNTTIKCKRPYEPKRLGTPEEPLVY